MDRLSFGTGLLGCEPGQVLRRKAYAVAWIGELGACLTCEKTLAAALDAFGEKPPFWWSQLVCADGRHDGVDGLHDDADLLCGVSVSFVAVALSQLLCFLRPLRRPVLTGPIAQPGPWAAFVRVLGGGWLIYGASWAASRRILIVFSSRGRQRT